MPGRKPIIGLAGGIASGKSLVAKLFGELGAAVISSDELNHQVLAREDVRRQLRAWWGDAVFDSHGEPDRQRIAAIVFNDDAQRRQLECLTHPLIDALRRALLRQYQAQDDVPAIILDVPLLFEVGQDAMCDTVIFVEANDDQRLQRARRQRGWDAEELRRRQAQQIPLDSKRQQSDYVIENNSDMNTLRRQVESIYRNLMTSR